MSTSIRASSAFAADDVALARDLAERARVHDGVAPFSDDLWNHVPAATTRHALVATDAAGEPVGVAFSADQGARHAAEVLVAPDRRGEGHGAALVAALLDAVNGELWLWSHGDHPAARALAARHDLQRARELLQLRRALGAPLDVRPLPPGVSVRTFVPGQDEEVWLAVNNAAFSWHPEQGRMTLADIQAAEARADFDPAGFFLAVRDDELLGYHWTKVHDRDPNPKPGDPEPGPIGEVYVLGVAPATHGSGIGSALTAIGLNHLAARGLDTVMLYVEGDNAPALKVYERTGFATHTVNVAYRRP